MTSFTYKQAKKLIEAAEGWLDHGLIRFVIEAKGCETVEHSRLSYRIGMKRPGATHWQSIPDFHNFNSVRHFLLGDDEDARVVMLQENNKSMKKLGRNHDWRVVLGCYKAPHEGEGHGSNPGQALAAAWLGLQIDRSNR